MTERPRFNPADIESKWQKRWEDEQTFKAERHVGRPKLYVLDMFPYPSGAGLHVGHPEGYTATDIVARYHRMKGFDVLHPMGWDAFGLPAEQHAIATGEHPSINTAANIGNFRRQLKSLGFSYDWSREVDTTDPNYVRWTQWIFLKLFERGLAYQSEIPVNWCPALGTVLANEEVVDGRSEVGHHPVIRTPLRQWLLKITAYADRLAADLDGLQWPETKKKQLDWIGRSEGASIKFAIDESRSIEVFTTRPDTIFGATYMVLAPEHALVSQITTDAQRAAVDAYRAEVQSRSDLDRTTSKKKTGVFTGAYATNPATGQQVPVWIADFVLATYGTGAIMSVPAHDERDFEFARAFGLPVVEVVSADGAEHDASSWKAAFTDDGIAVRSGFLNGKKTADAKEAMIRWIEEKSLGTRKVQYKLRDWVFSRQRYWGEPFPIYFPVELAAGVTDPRQGDHTIRYDQPIAVSESELPVRLPNTTDFRPGEDPAGVLARIKDWRFFERDGKWFARETNTMPQWAGSCWYYLRFTDPKNDSAAWSNEAYDAWMPVDLYVGGSEHAVLHLLYARFWHKVLFDCGYVKHAEPFTKLVHQGLILGELEYLALTKQDGTPVSFDDASPLDLLNYKLDSTEEPLITERLNETKFAEAVSAGRFEKRGNAWFVKGTNVKVGAQTFKMSKSRGNVVNPDSIVQQFGADSLRVYEMFMGPLEVVKPWQTNGVVGVRRFLDRVYSTLIAGDLSDSPASSLDVETHKLVHKSVKKVTEDIDSMRFNTAISTLMILVNRLAELPSVPREVASTYALLLAPFAPHLAEEIWAHLGHSQTLAYEAWPTFDVALTVDDVVEIPVQVNGKVKSRVMLRRDASEADARAAVAADELYARWSKARPRRNSCTCQARSSTWLSRDTRDTHRVDEYAPNTTRGVGGECRVGRCDGGRFAEHRVWLQLGARGPGTIRSLRDRARRANRRRGCERGCVVGVALDACAGGCTRRRR
ncbi:MAG: leucine--tRNA ligase [Polyangiaceae bacterium]